MTAISDESAPRTATNNRLALYDALKCVAAFGVIMFHAGVDHKDVWLSGMFLFLFFLGYHAATGRATLDYVIGRFRRLIIPWFFWCAVYWGLYAVRGEAWMPFDPIDWSTVLVGTNVHLWFLPFAFGACVLLASVNHLWTWTLPRVLASLVAVFALCGAILLVLEPVADLSVVVLLAGVLAWLLGRTAERMGCESRDRRYDDRAGKCMHRLCIVGNAGSSANCYRDPVLLVCAVC